MASRPPAPSACGVARGCDTNAYNGRLRSRPAVREHGLTEGEGRVAERSRHHEVAEGEREGEEPARHEAGEGEGQRDVPQRLRGPGSEVERGLEEGRGHALEGRRVTLPDRGPVNAWENPPLFVLDGWR